LGGDSFGGVAVRISLPIGALGTYLVGYSRDAAFRLSHVSVDGCAGFLIVASD
jgi:hypothetical protein